MQAGVVVAIASISFKEGMRVLVGRAVASLPAVPPAALHISSSLASTVLAHAPSASTMLAIVVVALFLAVFGIFAWRKVSMCSQYRTSTHTPHSFTSFSYGSTLCPRTHRPLTHACGHSLSCSAARGHCGDVVEFDF